MLFLALISVVAASDGKWKESAQCYPSGEPGDRVFDPTAFEDKEHASREAAMTECAEACDKIDNCHFAEFSRNSNNNLASCELWGSDCWEESLDDVWASEPAVYVKSGDLENWKKYDDSETALPAKGALGSLCYVAGDDPTLGDKNCNDGLLCAKKGYDNRDFGGCKSHGVVGPPFNQHCCSTPPAVQADGSSGSGASGSEDEASSAGSEDGSANNDAGKADGSSGSVASDVCTANHNARPGSTSSERCLALSGCCYDADTDHCGTCTDYEYVVVRHKDSNACECLPKDDPCLNDDVCFADATCKDDEDYVVVRHRDDSSCECTPAHDPCLNDDFCYVDESCKATDYNDGLGKWKYASIKSLETLREWCKINWDTCFACGGRWKGSKELGFCRKGRLQNKRLSKCKSFFRDSELCVHLGCNAIYRKNTGKTVCKNHLSSSGVSFDHLE